MNLLQMSLSGAVLIAVIALIRTLFINRFPKGFFLSLWGIALVRLILPFSIPSAFSVYSLFGRNEKVQDVITESPLATALPLLPFETMGFHDAAPVTNAGNNTFPWEITWFVGFMFFAVFFAICYITCLRNYKTSLPVSTNYTEKWLREHPARREISIRRSDLISSPLTYGFIRPVILLPKTVDLDNREQLNYIFLHEYIHIRRFDPVAKLLMIITLCLHWFNPLVWIMYFLFNRDLELSCDEAVVRKSGTESRAGYARTLVSMEEQRSVPTLLFNSFSKNTIEERIIAIMKPKKFTLFGGIAAFSLILCIGTCFLTSANAAEPDDSNRAQSQQNTDSTEIADAVATEIPANTEAENPPVANPVTGTDKNTDAIQIDLWTWPTESSTISSTFGTRVHPVTGENKTVDHINIAGEKGDDVYSAVAGIVTETLYSPHNGNCIYISVAGADDTLIIYGHLQDVLVSAGDEVSAGTLIGHVGATGMATGPNLSFGVFVDNVAIDPMKYFE